MSGRKIDGTFAFVTGANRGIGYALTEALLRRGAEKVYAAARDPAGLAPLSRTYSARIVPVTLDVTDADQVAKVAREARDVRLLFNNAGVAQATALVATPTVAQAQREMDVNYFGPLRMLQSFTDILAANGGAVVNVGSSAGLTNLPFLPTYSASKAALHSLTQASRLLFATRGIAVFGVYAGPVDTDMAKDLAFPKTSPGDVAEAILNGVEAGNTHIFPDPFAEACGQQFLSSPDASEQQVVAMLSGAQAAA